MEHSEARELLSARLDGELPSEMAPALDSHLGSCDACRAFADGAVRLRALTAALPREEPGELFTREPVRLRRRARVLRLAPAVAAALVLAILIVMIGPPGTFKVRVAAAAAPLTTIRTFYAEREIVTVPERGGQKVRERIWFRAPGYLRIERTSSDVSQLIIQRPGERYEQTGLAQTREIGLPPDANILPEPLSPAIALLGRRVGNGPVIDGRKTIHYILDLGDGRERIAFVDAERYTALGVTTESLILQKSGVGAERKNVLSFRINGPIDDAMFAIPNIPARDAGFRSGPLSKGSVKPLREPDGFRLVAGGAGPEGSRLLYARGAFTLQVDIATRELGINEQTTRTQPVTIDRMPATVIEDLYELPRITFEFERRIITITGPLTPEGLIDAARTMFLR